MNSRGLIPDPSVIVKEAWVTLWPSSSPSWSCVESEKDGFYVYGAEVRPSAYFCGLDNLPKDENNFKPYEIDGSSIRISLGFQDFTVHRSQDPQVPPPLIAIKPRLTLESQALFAVRYESRGRTDGRCYGALDRVSFATMVEGYFWGLEQPVDIYQVAPE